MLEILHKSKNIIVVSKPNGMPSEPDPTGDADAMTAASEALLALGEDSKLWLVHRLDRVVGGVMLFARNKSSAAEISKIIQDHLFAKEYLAVVEGLPLEGEYTDYLVKDARLSRSVIADKNRSGAKLATLSLKVLDTVTTDKGVRSLVYVTLHTGRFHQIRAQLSTRGTPIVGDGKYGSRDNKVKCIALFSAHVALEFKNERVDISTSPARDEYPWSLFRENERFCL